MGFRRKHLTTTDLDAIEVQTLTDAWDRACRGAGLVRRVETVSGTTEIPPRLAMVDLTSKTLSVNLEPGMVAHDVRALAPRLAPYLGAWGLRVSPVAHGASVVVSLLASDPLGRGPLPCPDTGSVLIGVTEEGERLVVDDPADIPHTAIQGATRSGKSAFLYSLLSAYTRHRRAGYPIAVDGIDPSGLLLRPFPGSVLGLSDLAAVEAFLADAVTDMDRRIAAIPNDRDTLEITEGNPVRVVVLEELPGLYRWIDALDAKAGKRIRSYVARLLCEGANPDLSSCGLDLIDTGAGRCDAVDPALGV